MKEVDEFLVYRRATNSSTHTLRSYRTTLEAFADMLKGMPIAQVGPSEIEQFLEVTYSRGVSKRTQAQRLAALKSWFRWLHDEGITGENVAAAFQGPRRPQRRLPVPTQEEAWRLCERDLRTAFPERDRLIVELLYGSGIRAEEAVSIDIADVSGHRLRIHGKGLKQRLVPLTEYAQRALLTYLPARTAKLGSRSTTALLFGLKGRRIERLTTRSLGRIVKDIAGATGVPWVSPHSLRRACATHLAENGAPHFYVFRLLGHSKISTTEHYIAQASRGRLLAAYSRGRTGEPHTGLDS